MYAATHDEAPGRKEYALAHAFQNAASVASCTESTGSQMVEEILGQYIEPRTKHRGSKSSNLGLDARSTAAKHSIPP